MKPVSESHARRVISRLDPSRFQSILQNERYWTVYAYNALLERCDDLLADIPTEGHQIALQMPTFAARVRGLSDAQISQSYAVLGSSYRHLANYPAAYAAYKRALELAADSPRAQALIRRRLAVLYAVEGNQLNAEKCIDFAAEHLSANPSERATTLTIRAVIVGDQQPRQALEHYAEALSLAHPLRDQNTYIAAARNLANLLATHGKATDCRTAAAYLARAKIALTRGCNGPSYKRRRRQRIMIQWSEALLDWRFGSHRRADRMLEQTAIALFDIAAVEDGLLCLVDRVVLALEMDDPTSAALIVREGASTARTFQLHQQSLIFQMLSQHLTMAAALEARRHLPQAANSAG